MCVSLILSFMPLKTGSPISKLVLLKLADNADARGVCFPSLNYLAQYCEVSLRTVTRHVNELEKQGFLQRIKRFDDSGRQRSNLYQLRVPEGCHIEQQDLTDDTPQSAVTSPTASIAPKQVNSLAVNPILDLNADQSDTHQEDNRSNTEGDPLAHIISHKEHKTGLNPNNVTESAHNESSGSKSSVNKSLDTKNDDDAVIHLLTQEGSAPIYHEFFTILESSYPNLDVLQQ
ncbi:MAG: helix-turn-helix domain-containing protein, partial [Pseudomonadota bacterium]|nr:helix-turn-helix domain-containing protein [Pseudomonadota bacterium]